MKQRLRRSWRGREAKPEAGGFSAIMLSPDTVTQNRDRWVAIKKDLFN
jgi:hypothetical protein